MTNCTTCGNRDYLCQECRHEALEAHHGTPADNMADDEEGIHCWVQALDETWCASMYLEGSRHVSACGTIHETPVEGVRYDPRRLESEDVCPDCLEALEDDDEISLPDGGRFERATELRADGGEELDRFTDLPVPDRFFQQISSADIDYRVEDWERDEIRFSGQNVPGGKFGFEIAATYNYAGYECEQHFTLGVDGAIALRKALGEALESRGYDPETGEREIVPDGGLEEVFRCETIVATDDGIAIGEDAAPEAGRDE